MKKYLLRFFLFIVAGVINHGTFAAITCENLTHTPVCTGFNEYYLTGSSSSWTAHNDNCCYKTCVANTIPFNGTNCQCKGNTQQNSTKGYYADGAPTCSNASSCPGECETCPDSHPKSEDGATKESDCFAYCNNSSVSGGGGTKYANKDRVNYGISCAYTVKCNNGRYKNGTGEDATCPACPASSYQSATDHQNASCTPCGNGTYGTTTGQLTSASACNYSCYSLHPLVATFSDNSWDAATKTVKTCRAATCKAGSYRTGDTCTKCPAGTFSSAGATSCTPCAAGKYSYQEGSSSCLDCTAGKYSTGSATSCSTCPAGTYANNTLAATSCSLCNRGTTSSAGSSTANACSTCSNAANVASPVNTGWKNPTWNQTTNTTTNICEINQCSGGYKKTGTGNGTNIRCTPVTYTVEFLPNYGTGGSGTGSMTPITCIYGSWCQLPPNGFTKNGGTFSEWNTQADEGGVYYSDEDGWSYPPTTPGNDDNTIIKLFAVWQSCNNTANVYEWASGDCTIKSCNEGYYVYGSGTGNKCNECPSGHYCPGGTPTGDTCNQTTGLCYCPKGYYCPAGGKRYTCDAGKTSGTYTVNKEDCYILGGTDGTKFCDKRGCFFIPTQIIRYGT